ncbi:MAG: hypothetical protein PHP66_00010 [Syntrophales bacterium]|nr:hypothetical protein [Syntrophales bacterium]
MNHLKSKETQRKLGFQEIDEEQSGQYRSCAGRNQGALPVLGKNGFKQKSDEYKGHQRKSDYFEKKQIGHHGQKGHNDSLPGIGQRKEGRHGLPFSPLEAAQQQKNGHHRQDNAGPERHETGTRLTPVANFDGSSIERKKDSHAKKKQCGYPIVMI